jgi:hypothetical protein
MALKALQNDPNNAEAQAVLAFAAAEGVGKREEAHRPLWNSSWGCTEYFGHAILSGPNTPALGFSYLRLT